MSTVEQLTEDVANAREQRDQWQKAYEMMAKAYYRVYQQCQTERQLKEIANDKLRASEEAWRIMRDERDMLEKRVAELEGRQCDGKRCE